MRQIKDIINQYDTYPSWVPAFAAESGYVSSNDTRTRGMKTAERLTHSVHYLGTSTSSDNKLTEQGIASTQRVFDDTLK